MASRATYSCTRCADRKVKCDRQRPCSNCSKRNLECIFNANPPVRKRQKRAKDQALTDRLKYYEELLHAQGVDPSQLPDTSEYAANRISEMAQQNANPELQLQTPSSITSDPERCISKSQLLHSEGKTKFVDK